MVTKQAVPQPMPLPQDVPPEELEGRSLHYAAIPLIEHLSAKENNVDDITIQALVFNLQNLMRLYDRHIFTTPLRNGSIEFNRVITSGDWENGQWRLAWTVRDASAE